MTFLDLYELCINLRVEIKVYVYVVNSYYEITCEDVMEEQGGKHIKWFCFKTEGVLR